LERRRSGGHGPRITVPSVSKIARVLAAFPAGMIDPIGAPLVLFPGFLGLGDARDEPVPATRGFDPRGEYVGGSAQLAVCTHGGVEGGCFRAIVLTPIAGFLGSSAGGLCLPICVMRELEGFVHRTSVAVLCPALHPVKLVVE